MVFFHYIQILSPSFFFDFFEHFFFELFLNFSKNIFFQLNYSQRLAPPAQQPPPPVGADPGLASPPPYNPTPGPFNAPSEIDRRRANLRARNGDENAQYSSGPKNKYGKTESKFHLFTQIVYKNSCFIAGDTWSE